MAKQIQESITEYGKGDRQDLVDEEMAKLSFIKSYLPQQISDGELKTIINEVIASADNKAMGPIIGMVMKKVAGSADGKRVSAMVREML